MRFFYLLVLLSSFLLFSCRDKEKYQRTSKVCDDNLYVEKFSVNSWGLFCHYLTDSANFRLPVGDYDEEHERFSYECKGDSIRIVKQRWGDDARWVTLPNGQQAVESDTKFVVDTTISRSALRQQYAIK